MSKTFSLLALSIGLMVAATGCGPSCDDAEEACRACGTEAASCERTVGICRVGGPAEDDCCGNLYDEWEHCL